MQTLEDFKISNIIMYFLSFILQHLTLCLVQSILTRSFEQTNGYIFHKRIDKFYNTNIFENHSNTTLWKCVMAFSTESRFFSMNIVDNKFSKVDCYLMMKKANEEKGLLIDKNGSTYYEKLEKLESAVFSNPSPVTTCNSIDWDCTAMGSIPPPLFTYTITRAAGGQPVAISSPYSPKEEDNGAIVTCTATHTGRDTFAPVKATVTLAIQSISSVSIDVPTITPSPGFPTPLTCTAVSDPQSTIAFELDGVAIADPNNFSPSASDGGKAVTCIATLPGTSCSRSDSFTLIIEDLFINEFHYDNVGTDIDEFIEVAGKAGVDLSSWSLVLYNGAVSEVYETISLSGILGNDSNGFGFHWVAVPNSIQNGGSDGIALVKTAGSVTKVIEFLSYEGSMTAVNGPANGQTSDDIGISETNSTPIGFSLQRTGTGSKREHFTWTADMKTFGNSNTGQNFT